MSTSPSDADRFPYPTDTVVGIAADESVADDAIQRLGSVGLDTDQVDLLQGAEGAQRIDPDGQGHGLAGEYKRKLQNLWGNDATNAREYAEQLRNGATLVAVGVGEREQAQRVGAALRDVGLTCVRYYSRNVVESL